MDEREVTRSPVFKNAKDGAKTVGAPLVDAIWVAHTGDCLPDARNSGTLLEGRSGYAFRILTRELLGPAVLNRHSGEVNGDPLVITRREVTAG